MPRTQSPRAPRSYTPPVLDIDGRDLSGAVSLINGKLHLELGPACGPCFRLFSFLQKPCPRRSWRSALEVAFLRRAHEVIYNRRVRSDFCANPLSPLLARTYKAGRVREFPVLYVPRHGWYTQISRSFTSRQAKLPYVCAVVSTPQTIAFLGFI